MNDDTYRLEKLLIMVSNRGEIDQDTHAHDWVKV